MSSGNPTARIPILNRYSRLTKWLEIIVCWAICFSALHENAYGKEQLPPPFEWTESPEIVFPEPSEGAFVGITDNRIFVASGETLSPEGQKVFKQTIWTYDLRTSNPSWKQSPIPMPHPRNSGATVVLADGILCIGGKGDRGFSQAITKLRFDETTQSTIPESFGTLPEPLSDIKAVLIGSALFVTGSRPSDSNRNLAIFSVELSMLQGEPIWNSHLPPIDKPNGPVAMLRQYNGENDSLYLIFHDGSLVVFDLLLKTWNSISPIQEDVALITAAPIGATGIFAIGADSFPAEGAPHRSFFFNTITRQWVASGDLPWSDNTTRLLPTPTGPWAASNLGFRKAKDTERPSFLSPIDILVLAVYFSALIWIGIRSSKKGSSTNDYFRAGKRIPGWAAGCSLIVTSLSAITFMSAPAKSFATNWLFLLVGLFQFVGALIVYFFFLPLIMRMDVTTAYEYLEKRFGPSTRYLGSGLFLLSETFRMGSVAYMPALALSVVTGIDIMVCIVMIGIVATIYTFFGGIEAVIWTDVLQLIIMVGGLLCTLFVVFQKIDIPAFEAIGTAWKMEKFKIINTDLDFKTVTIWVVLLNLSMGANSYVSNQAMFQRLVTGEILLERSWDLRPLP